LIQSAVGDTTQEFLTPFIFFALRRRFSAGAGSISAFGVFAINGGLLPPPEKRTRPCPRLRCLRVLLVTRSSSACVRVCVCMPRARGCSLAWHFYPYCIARSRAYNVLCLRAYDACESIRSSFGWWCVPRSAVADCTGVCWTWSTGYHTDACGAPRVLQIPETCTRAYLTARPMKNSRGEDGITCTGVGVVV